MNKKLVITVTIISILVVIIVIVTTNNGSSADYSSFINNNFFSSSSSSSSISSPTSSSDDPQIIRSPSSKSNNNNVNDVNDMNNNNDDFSFKHNSQGDDKTATSLSSSSLAKQKSMLKPHHAKIPSYSSSSVVRKPFKFHIYKLPHQYVEGAIETLKQTWHVSICNRGNKKSNYTMLDWRHAHSLFTADVYITRFMRKHPQHTENPDEADAFIIPMMSHLYNCAGRMNYQIDILSMILNKYPKTYKEMDQRDHYLFWWRWGMHYGSVQKFWKRVTKFFPNVNLISFDLLEIMGRNQFQDFSLALKPKFDRNLLNIIMPYPDFSPILSSDENLNIEQPDEIHQRKRSLLFYFAGTSTIGGIRRWIKWNCEKNRQKKSNNNNKPEDCVYVDFATSVTDLSRLGVPKDYPRAMKDSVFCGHAAGDALSSRRPTSAILAGCIPVLICDLCLYAWEGQIDYSAFSIFIPESEVIAGNLVSILKKIESNSTHVKMLRENLKLVRKHFVYHEGTPQEGDALDMLAKELEKRGTLMRQYRRWYQMNGALSGDLKDYPVDPPASIKKYVLRKSNGEIDQKDAQLFPSRTLPV